MLRKLMLGIALFGLAFLLGCTNKKSANPLANVGSKQPDKVLFDRSMDAMKHNRFDVARMTLQTLINTYPDSEYIARAKLAVADSWYAEGGTTAMQQAEIEYKDFKTFFPNMPEAAEAQLKVANIHYQEMEKPDRDYTHAERAEEEYRALIQEYPDSKLVPQARQRLREVQEVLAQREFNIGQFYYLRMAYPASIARLKTLVERYPLYSGADQALFLLGLLGVFWGWYCAVAWAAATHIAAGGEPDLIGFSFWAIFLSLGFYTLWALVSWALQIAPLLMLLEKRSALVALWESVRLGKTFSGKLVEINLVMGIVKLALLVLAMVLSAAPLPFSDQLGADALHGIGAVALIFYFVASDYFQVVRLKGFVEFWRMFRRSELAG